MGAGESRTMSWSYDGIEPGVGELISICEKKGALCGRGDRSIYSTTGAGELEGSGGVVTKSDVTVSAAQAVYKPQQ